MNVWKKIGALTFVLIVALALSVSAFAEKTDGDLASDGIVGDFTTPDTRTVYNDVVYMYKGITAFNKEDVTVNAPTITYKYTIAPGEANKDIYDVKSAHRSNASAYTKTKAGVGTPTIQGTVDGGTTFVNDKLQFTPSVQLTATSAGTENKTNFKIKVDFSSIDFSTTGTGAGVYRYVITERIDGSTSDDVNDVTGKAAAGITDGTINNVRYMDVYVDGNGEIYGYVCFVNNNNIDARDTGAVEADSVANAVKTEGFVTIGNNTSDAYYTFNFEVKKIVDNDEYTKTSHHQFPFSVKLDNATVTAQILPIMTVGTNATQAALSAFVIGTGNNATEWSPTIADSATVKYVGIPVGTTVTIHETNDLDGTNYSAAITNADTIGNTITIGKDAVSSDAVVTTTASVLPSKNYTNTDAVTFTNTLVNISPTGVTLRYAPYFLTLGAGVVALPLTRSYRRREED